MIGSEGNVAIAQMHTNLLGWLNSTGNVCRVTDAASTTACMNDANVTTLLYDGGVWDTSNEDAAVKAWIQGGKSFVFGIDKTEFQAATERSVMALPFYYKILLDAGIAMHQKKAAVAGSAIDTTAHNMNDLHGRNLAEYGPSLTYENFESNEHLDFILSIVQANPCYWRQEVSHIVLQPLEDFVSPYDDPPYMVYPTSTLTDKSGDVVMNSTHEKMFKVQYLMALADLWREKAINVDDFPGDIDNPPSAVTESFSFTSKKFKYGFPTCTYLAPGACLTISVTNDASNDDYIKYDVIIGMHTDKIKINEGTTRSIHRHPEIKFASNLIDREMTVCWPWGGLVSFRAPGSENKVLSVSDLCCKKCIFSLISVYC